MKLKNLIVEDLNIDINEKLKKIKSGLEKNNRRFFKDETLNAWKQLIERIKK
jgi:hypothetical protein